MKRHMRTLLLASRPVSWINTAYPFAAAYLMTSRNFDWLLLVGTLFFLVPYNLLMYGINDVFDYESDLRNPRKGGLEGAKVRRQERTMLLRVSVAASLPWIVVLLTQGNMAAKCTLVVILFMVVAYSAPLLRFKERPVIDSFTSASHFAGPMVYGLMLTGWQAHYWPYAVAFMLWGMASHAFGAVQDIIPDREANIRSIATDFGAKYTVWLAAAAYLVASATVLLAQPGAFAVSLCGLLYVLNILPYVRIRDTDSGSANAAWRRFIWLNMLTGAVITITLTVFYRTA